MHRSFIFLQVISRHGMKPDPQKIKAITEMPLQKKNKKEFQKFLEKINYLSKFSPSTADVCEALSQLTSVKTRVDLEHNIPETI